MKFVFCRIFTNHDLMLTLSSFSTTCEHFSCLILQYYKTYVIFRVLTYTNLHMSTCDIWKHLTDVRQWLILCPFLRTQQFVWFCL